VLGARRTTTTSRSWFCAIASRKHKMGTQEGLRKSFLIFLFLLGSALGYPGVLQVTKKSARVPWTPKLTFGNWQWHPKLRNSLLISKDVLQFCIDSGPGNGKTTSFSIYQWKTTSCVNDAMARLGAALWIV
jgi:hypothetical protein